MNHFRSKISCRPDDGARSLTTFALRVGLLHRPEVAHFDATGNAHKQIGRLNVAVQKVVGMEIGDASKAVRAIPPDHGVLQRGARGVKYVEDRSTGKPLHNYSHFSFLNHEVNAMDQDDVGMVEFREALILSTRQIL